MKTWKQYKKKKKQTAKNFNVRYIVVHTTGTRSALRELDSLPYHYLITKTGKVINLRPLSPLDGTIEVALSGGINKLGNHVDTRTPEQTVALFQTLAMLSVSFQEAKVVGADEVYVYAYANPCFNVRDFMNNYVPSILLAA